LEPVNLLEEPINKTDEPEPLKASATTTGAESLVAPQAKTRKHILSVFALALVIRLWFNFATNHPNAYASCDAAEYLRYADALSKVISGHSSLPMAEALKEFVITGPALPVFLVLASALSFQPFDPANSAVPLVAQSLISALTAALIYLIARRLYEGKTALTAGIIAAVYPAFIVNSGRLYSETFATFIECLAVFLLVRGFFAARALPLTNFVLGASVVVGQLTRSAMILLTAVSLPIVFLQGLFSSATERPNWRGAGVRVALALAGVAFILCPWFIFEKAAYNKMTMSVDRVGHYNLFIGTNTATQGFLSYPYPDGRGIEEKSFLALINRAAKQSPARFFKLIMDKPARLLKSPWNDFRCPIGPFEYQIQVALHQIILLLSIVGIALACVVQPASENEPTLPANKIWGRLSLLLAFGLNLPYLAFITVPRYNLTAMPFLIVFAAAGLTTAIYLIRTFPLAKAPKALPIFALCLFVFLRDDPKDAFNIGHEPIASVVLVQGQDFIAKGIISVAFGLAFYLSIYFCLSLLSGYKKTAAALTSVLAVATLPLLAIPQRANGRPGESILTFERPGECLEGTIPLPRQGAGTPDLTKAKCYLLLDVDDATIFNGKFDLTVNGQKMTGPLIPGISALDDWHYLKPRANNQAYLECAYIYDCMTQPAGITNLDLRQWFYLPLRQEAVAEAQRRGCLNVSIKHKVEGPTKIFGAALAKDHAYIPSRAIYSWEKAFYGVENDSGLTDSRFDEKVPLRASKWHMNYEKASEDLGNFDLNLRLLALKDDSTAEAEVTAGGAGDLSMPLSDEVARESELVLIRATIAPVALSSKADSEEQRAKGTPALSLKWLDKSGKEITMPLPWLKNSKTIVDVAVPCNLAEVAKQGGHHFSVNVHCPDAASKITISERRIKAHPIFGEGTLY
jgi:4-amino-4-deoxy-L-arabinose transferase-like glycosyltransferase